MFQNLHLQQITVNPFAPPINKRFFTVNLLQIIKYVAFYVELRGVKTTASAWADLVHF